MLQVVNEKLFRLKNIVNLFTQEVTQTTGLHCYIGWRNIQLADTPPRAQNKSNKDHLRGWGYPDGTHNLTNYLHEPKRTQDTLTYKTHPYPKVLPNPIIAESFVCQPSSFEPMLMSLAKSHMEHQLKANTNAPYPHLPINDPNVGKYTTHRVSGW